MSDLSVRQRRQVLVVDDEPIVLELVSNVMQEAGYKVTTATSGAEGLEEFWRRHWDLVVTDRTMPGMNGEEMVTAMKAAQADLPVILVTGLPDSVVRADLFETILRKPFRRPELLAAVKAMESAHHGMSR